LPVVCYKAVAALSGCVCGIGGQHSAAVFLGKPDEAFIGENLFDFGKGLRGRLGLYRHISQGRKGKHGTGGV
jgi:hypothetical protein